MPIPLDDEFARLQALAGAGFLTSAELNVQRDALTAANDTGALTEEQCPGALLSERAALVTSGAMTLEEFNREKADYLWHAAEDTSGNDARLDDHQDPLEATLANGEPAASTVFSYSESLESLLTSVPKAFFEDLATPLHDGNIRPSTVTIVERSTGRAVGRFHGIKYRHAAERIFEMLDHDLANLSVAAFGAKYGGVNVRIWGTDPAALEAFRSDGGRDADRICDVCQRHFARSELMAFNTPFRVGDHWGAMCPACGDDRNKHRLLHRPPLSYTVATPDLPRFEACVNSYVAHGWTVGSHRADHVDLARDGRTIAVQIVP